MRENIIRGERVGKYLPFFVFFIGGHVHTSISLAETWNQTQLGWDKFYNCLTCVLLHSTCISLDTSNSN